MPSGPKLPPRPMARRPAPAPDVAEQYYSQPSRRAAGDEETAAGTALIAAGRQGAQDIKDAIPSNYPELYDIPDVGDGVPTEPELIKFVSGIDVPTVAWAEHWCGAGRDGNSGWITEGKRSFVCLGENCPLCDVGHSPKKWEIYNVLDMRNPEKPLLRVLRAAKTLAADLAVLDRIPRSTPVQYGTLARKDMYWRIWRVNNLKGDKGTPKTHLEKIPARDLYDEYHIEPYSDAELAEWTAKAWPSDKIVQVSSWADVKAAADSAPSMGP
jgi:hypothetical protein